MFSKSPWVVALAVSVVVGCGGTESASSSPQSLLVDNNGARLETQSRLGRLDIPQGALQGQVEIQLVERFDAAGRHEVEIQPAQIQFAKPAKLTFKIPDPVRPELEHAVEVQVQNQVEVEVEIQKQVCDVLEREIQAEVNHTGRFRREDKPL